MATNRPNWSKAKRLSKQLIVAAGLDAYLAVEQAQLRYVTDQAPGIRRRRHGKGFRYVDEKGRPVTDVSTLQRIHSLVIPPAWQDVWVCTIANGHLQCTGRDARGRKQYRYHARWREVRDESKFARLAMFGAALPKIRRRVARDLKRRGLPREKVLALIVRLLETTLIRIGNEEYARENGSFGLTTFRNKHAQVKGSSVRFRFRGKSGKDHEIGVNDRRLAMLVKRCRDLPGQELFQYLDEQGQVCSIGSSEVNNYLREIAGAEFTAKDFRTWHGTMLAAANLAQGGEHARRQGSKAILQTVKTVAQRLGNTVAVCRKCYIHPAIFDGYLEGTLCTDLACLTQAAADSRAAETALLDYLISHTNRASRRQAG